MFDMAGIAVEIGQRRAGDPAVLVADASKAARELGWSAIDSDIDFILETALAWQRGARHSSAA